VFRYLKSGRWIFLVCLLCIAGDGFSLTVPEIKFLLSIEGKTNTDRLSNPLDFCVDRQRGEIYICDTGNNRVLIFDKNGVFRHEIDGKTGLSSPMGVTVTPQDRIYVAEMSSYKLKLFDFAGRFPGEVGLHLKDSDGVFMPGRLTSDKSGNLYVIDRRLQRIVALGNGGEFRFQFEAGQSNRQGISLLQDIMLDEEKNRVYTVSSLGKTVRVFDTAGKALFGFGEHGSAENAFSFPTGIAEDKDGRLWIIDSFQHKIKVFDGEGKFLFQVGRMGTQAGSLFFPVSVKFDGEGRLNVLERGVPRLQVFQVHY
jgi:DNA-binding beta-propeller fold protein YncE